MLGNAEWSYYVNVSPETIFDFHHVWNKVATNTGITTAVQPSESVIHNL